MQKTISIDQAFEKLENVSYVCHWHKMDIIDAYVNRLPNFMAKLLDFHPIRQKFAYDFNVEGHKCQIENCERDAEIRLVKKEGLDLKW